MKECPYCGADSTEDARFCDRCGERLAIEEQSREGFLGRSSIQYLQGVRHGARPLDPDSAYHEGLRADVGAAIEDFSYLAAIESLDLSAVIDIDDTQLGELDATSSPDTDLSESNRRALGLAVLIGLLNDAYEGHTLDEIRARGVQTED